MSFKMIGSVDPTRLFCSGSFTKLLTTFITLSLFSEKYQLNEIIDSDNFLNEISLNPAAKNFLQLFQKKIGSQFSLHDIYSYYMGLPYTFDVAESELIVVEKGFPFKHHSIIDESVFLSFCENEMTPLYRNRCKFHYSELAIIFLGYLVEKIYSQDFEFLFQKYILDPFKLNDSLFSRIKPEHAYYKDLSPHYDYPSIAILDHGFFCYSNGFFTTLNDMKLLLDNLILHPIFHFMTDIKLARAASHTIMNGLTVEMRIAGDDLVYGYEGLSYSGCNIWAYSTKHRQGYLTFTENEEEAYTLLYDEQLGYSEFAKAPPHTQLIYQQFIKNFINQNEEHEIPVAYQGKYQRVNINESTLLLLFEVGKNFIIIRNPEEIRYEVIWVNGNYHVHSKDQVPGTKVGFIESGAGNCYMYFDGTLYKKID